MTSAVLVGRADETAPSSWENGDVSKDQATHGSNTTTNAAAVNVPQDAEYGTTSNNHTAGRGGSFASGTPNPETVVNGEQTPKTNTAAGKKQRRKQGWPDRSRCHTGFRRRWAVFCDRWPRLLAILTRQLLVYSLLVVTLIFGYLLSLMEGPIEIQHNDEFLQQTWFLKSLPIEQTTQALVTLPSTCLLEFAQHYTTTTWNTTNTTTSTNNTNTRNNMTTTNSQNPLSDTNFLQSELTFEMARLQEMGTTPGMEEANISWHEIHTFMNDTFPQINVLPNDVYLPTLPPVVPTPLRRTNATTSNEEQPATTLFAALYEYMQACEDVAGDLLGAVLNFTLEVGRHDFALLIEGEDSAPGELTFNWIRCWNTSQFGHSDPFRPSPTQIEASLYTHQWDYFVAEWNLHRLELYHNLTQQYGCAAIPSQVDATTTTVATSNTTMSRVECYWEATKQSVVTATGGKGCDANTGSSAWFWFTVMTTVGYGNFGPNTNGGRILIYCLGWLSIIAFGGIMMLAGYTYTTIVDDLFVRCNLHWLKQPKYSTLLWGFFTGFYIIFIAYNARQFWDSRVPDFTYTVGDSYWFSYISTLTVGLGDYFLQPQGIFIVDVFQWTTLMLHGFVFMSSFLGKFGDLLQQWFPSRGETLAKHIARTNLCCGQDLNIPVSASLDILRELVEDIEHYPAVETTGTDPIKYRSSFVGNMEARAPDGNTIQFHRIRLLIEKKNLLIKLLEDAQSELEARINDSLTNGPQNNTQNNNNNSNNTDPKTNTWDGIDPLALHHISQSMTTVEDLQYEENVLELALSRTKKLRTHVQTYQTDHAI